MEKIPGWSLHRQEPWGLDHVGDHSRKMMEMMLMMGSAYGQEGVMKLFTCPKCKKVLEEDSVYCGACGLKLPAQVRDPEDDDDDDESKHDNSADKDDDAWQLPLQAEA
eukprot:409592-Karenia_brevis.AAC.1